MKTIFMIIDDDQDDRYFFKEAIADMVDLSICLEAYDGAHALDQLRKAARLPDFIFIDVNMPRMDGKECLKELKKDAKLKSIPVIMYSTYFSKESIEEFRELGSLHHLTKPTSMKKLREQILVAMTSSITPA